MNGEKEKPENLEEDTLLSIVWNLAESERVLVVPSLNPIR